MIIVLYDCRPSLVVFCVVVSAMLYLCSKMSLSYDIVKESDIFFPWQGGMSGSCHR